jgi:hypothetical protein
LLFCCACRAVANAELFAGRVLILVLSAKSKEALQNPARNFANLRSLTARASAYLA